MKKNLILMSALFAGAMCINDGFSMDIEANPLIPNNAFEDNLEDIAALGHFNTIDELQNVIMPDEVNDIHFITDNLRCIAENINTFINNQDNNMIIPMLVFFYDLYEQENIEDNRINYLDTIIEALCNRLDPNPNSTQQNPNRYFLIIDKVTGKISQIGHSIKNGISSALQATKNFIIEHPEIICTTCETIIAVCNINHPQSTPEITILPLNRTIGKYIRMEKYIYLRNMLN